MNLNRNSNILIEEMVNGPSDEEGTLQKRLGITPFQQQGVLTGKAAEYRKF